jgi:transcriptional regulator with XRE-family HTH domain
MADRTGLSKSYVRNLENREVYKPQAETVYRVAAALGVSMEYILGVHTDLPSVQSVNFYNRFLRLPTDKQLMLIKLLEAVEQV